MLVQNTYKLDKKESYGSLLRRIQTVLIQAGIPVSYRCSFQDSPGGSSGPAIDRAVKRYPQLADCVEQHTFPGLANHSVTTIAGNESTIPFAHLCELADGIPRSFPFPSASTVFLGDAFGPPQALPLGTFLGVMAADHWGIPSRKRALAVGYLSENLAPTGLVGTLLAILGKPAKSNQLGLDSPAVDVAPLAAIIKKYRSNIPEITHHAHMPNALPPLEQARAERNYEPHPLKPTLESRFKPLGYSCKGGSGIFDLRRKTKGNHVVGLMLDVGTWSRSVTAHFHFFTHGFRASLPLPVSPGFAPFQYPIGAPAQWEKIVENLAALTRHLESTLIPELDTAAGIAPAWFDAPQ